MAETSGIPTQPYLDPEDYGDWLASEDSAQDRLDAEDSRFIGPAELTGVPPRDQAPAQGAPDGPPWPEGAQGRGATDEATLPPAAPALSAVPFEGALLSRIAREIRSIRSDLTALKDQFEAVEPAVAPVMTPAVAPVMAPKVPPVATPAAASAPEALAVMAEPAEPAEPAVRAAAHTSIPPSVSVAEAPPCPVPANELAALLRYLDRLLESLPEEKIEEFARSEYFDLYRSVFDKLGLV